MSAPHSLEVDTVARTAWGEARGCGVSGMQAVINVIYNRSRHPIRWPMTAAGVCTQAKQFSCRNANDPNWPLLCAVTDADPQFKDAVTIAARAAAGKLADLTLGADCYYARSMTVPPYWTRGAVRTYSDRCHIYLRTLAVSDAPCVSGSAADALNAAELNRIQGTKP